jgi:hypothetical protein
MNARQTAFYRQARSDWSVFLHLRPGQSRWSSVQRAWCRLIGVRLVSFPVCHELHYLQMCTEKLAKAYYQTTPIRDGHAAFRRFINDLPANPMLLGPLGFANTADLTRWRGSANAIIGAIEDLAPTLAERKHLPNPEYPWPRDAPTVAPIDHPFTAEVYDHLDAQAASGEPPFLLILDKMVETMQTSAWHL